MLFFSNPSQTMRYSPWLSSSEFYLAPRVTVSSGQESCFGISCWDLHPANLHLFQLFSKDFPQLFASPYTALPSRALCFMLFLHPKDPLDFSPDPSALFAQWISWCTLYVCYVPAFVNNSEFPAQTQRYHLSSSCSNPSAHCKLFWTLLRKPKAFTSSHWHTSVPGPNSASGGKAQLSTKISSTIWKYFYLWIWKQSLCSRARYPWVLPFLQTRPEGAGWKQNWVSKAIVSFMSSPIFGGSSWIGRSKNQAQEHC